MAQWQYDTDTEIMNYSSTTYPSATLSTTDLNEPGIEPEPEPRGEMANLAR